MLQRTLCPVVVGRQEELSEIEDALLAALRGEGRLVLLAGDAGMGKSRLATELRRQADELGMETMWGGCSEADLSLPYLPFVEAIGRHLRQADLATLREALGRRADSLAPVFPQLAGEGSPRMTADPVQAKLSLFEATTHLLALTAGPRGLLLVLEDLHWSDESTRDLLEYMARTVEDTRILVLGTYRRDELHRRHPLAPLLQSWRRSGAATVVELNPLDQRAVGEMIAAILDRSEVPARTSQLFFRRTEGNPFVLEEMLKSAGPEPGETVLPDSVREMILSRVEKLSPDELDVLRAASVLGENIDDSLLLEVCGAGVTAALEDCVRQQLLVPRPDGSYRWRHALTREAVYEDMATNRRMQLHSRIADLLMRREATPAVEICHHLIAAHRWDEAVPRCQAAAAEASAVAAHADSIRLLELCLPHLPRGIDRALVLHQIGQTLIYLGRAATGQQYLEEAVELMRSHGSAEQLVNCRHAMRLALWELGRTDAAMRQMEASIAEQQGEGGSPLYAAYGHSSLAYLHSMNLDRAAAEREIELATSAFAEGGAPAEEVALHLASPRAWSSLVRGDPADSIKQLDQAWRSAVGADLIAFGKNLFFFEIATFDALGRVRDGLELARERPRQGRTRDVLDALCDLAEAPLHWCAGDVHTALSLLEGLEEEQSEGASRAMMVRTLAAVYASADRIEEIPALRAGFGCPVLLFRIWSPDAYAFLAMGEPEAALDEIDDLKAIAHLPDYLRCPPAELVVEALLALERVDEAAELVAAAAGSDHPSQLLMEARLARARGEDGRSAARAFEAAAQFRELGNVLNAWRAERLRAESLLAAGHVSEAEPVLRRVIAEALPGGEKLQARLAAEALTAAGLDPVADVSTPEAPVPLGERMVSVLFADVRGYTQLAGDTAPADLSSKMGAFHRWSRREIERQRGVVDKFAGDAVMATFNVAGNQVDHAESALQAAIALSDKAALLGLGVGVGIATGPAVVGQLTAGANLSVLGTTTNLAARLQTEAQGGEIVLDEEAHRRIRSDVDASRELLQVKGFKQPVPGYRIRRRLGAPAPVPSARPESNGSGGVKPARLGPLSRRESEVAMLVAQGLTNRQIAERLHISERTAEGHLDKIRSKLGLSNRAQVAAWVTER